MVREISNGRQVVKLYHSVNRGKAMYQLAYYAGGRRVQKNFADKSEAKRVAKQILGELSNDAAAVEAMATPELESLIVARRFSPQITRCMSRSRNMRKPSPSSARRR